VETLLEGKGKEKVAWGKKRGILAGRILLRRRARKGGKEAFDLYWSINNYTPTPKSATAQNQLQPENSNIK